MNQLKAYGVLAIVVGIVLSAGASMVERPGSATETTAWVLAWFALVTGIVLLTTAMTLRNAQRRSRGHR